MSPNMFTFFTQFVLAFGEVIINHPFAALIGLIIGLIALWLFFGN